MISELEMMQKKRLTHRIHTRVTREKYEELYALMKRSNAQHSMSELLRHILEQKEIKVKTYDASLDKVMEELSAIRTQIAAIGVNINQVTRRFHTEKLPGTKLLAVLDLTTLFQQSDQKITELFSIIAKLSEKWLPGS